MVALQDAILIRPPWQSFEQALAVIKWCSFVEYEKFHVLLSEKLIACKDQTEEDL